MPSMVRKAWIGQGGRMQFHGPVRAVVGLLASAAEEAKHLPDRAIELPMLAVSTALQVSLRAQQRYARLAARGDEVLGRRKPSDEPPEWATFADPVSIDELRRGALSADQAQAASDLLDELLGPLDDTSAEPDDSPANAAAPARKAPARKAAAAPARKAPAKKASRSAAASTSATGAAPARRAPASKAPAKRAADAGRTTDAGRTADNGRTADDGRAADDDRGKSVSKPRHTAPSKFDAVDDD